MLCLTTTLVLMLVLVLVQILVLVQVLVAVAVTVAVAVAIAVAAAVTAAVAAAAAAVVVVVVVLDDCGDTYEGLWLDLAGFPFCAPSAELPPVPTHNFCLQRQRFGTRRGDGTAIVVMFLPH